MIGSIRRRVIVTVALAACMVQLAGGAQESQAPQIPTFRSRVTLVPIDVRVLDRSGKPVADLRREDFALAEDGVPQEIAHFERQALVASRPDAGAPLVLRTTGAPEMKRQERRVFLIVLRPSYWLPTAQFGVVEAVTRFLRERLLPQDYAALWAWDRVTDVTTDHDAVARVLERLAAYQASTQGRPDSFAIYQAFRLNGNTGHRLPPAVEAEINAAFLTGTTSARSLPRITSREISGLLAQVSGHAVTEAGFRGDGDLGRARAAGATNQVIVLFSAIQHLRFLEGEKHLIYLSPGGLRLPAVEDDRGIARLASDARVVLHVIQSGDTMDLFTSMASKRVAELTGGRAFINQYPDRAPAQIDQMTRIGYLLAYYPSNANLDGRRRRVTVTVKRPSGATVLCRQSYEATDRAVPYDEHRFIVQDRVMTAGEYGGEIKDIALKVQAVTKSGTVTATVVIDPARVDPEEADERYAGMLEVAFFCTDPRERLVGQVWQTVDLRLRAETYQRLLAEGLRHTADIPVTGSAGYLKVVVYDYRSDRLGSAIVRLR